MTHRFVATLALVALAAAACGGGGEDASDPTASVPTTAVPGPGAAGLTGTSWVVVSFGIDGADDPVLPDAVPTIRFFEDGTIGGNSGCNSFGGSIALGPGDGVSIVDLAWTEMACMDQGVMDQEQRFFQALARVDTLADRDAGPTLVAADGSAAIVLAAPEPTPELPLSGAWRLTTFVDGDTAASTVAGTEVTLTIDSGAGMGTLSGSGGCNQFTGSFEITGGSGATAVTVVVGDVATTLMACAPEIMDQEARFHAALSDAATMTVEGTTLTLSTGDGRALVFEPAEG
ncbi:MAG: META domain-containing protein [Actinobacteria bacterium]|nr:META domain-containing protein [Actinomycetota bacterium]